MGRNPEMGPVLPEAFRRRYKYQAVCILPEYPFPEKQIGFDLHGITERIANRKLRKHESGLLPTTRARVGAAVGLAFRGETNRIVFSSRSVRPWMREYYQLLEEDYIRLSERFSDRTGIKNPQVELITEKESYDLYTELEMLQIMTKKEGWEKVGVITDSVQAIRTGQYLDTLEFREAKIITMEKILTNKEYLGKDYARHFSQMIDRWHNSPYWKFWRFREWVARNAPQEMLNKLDDITR